MTFHGAYFNRSLSRKILRVKLRVKDIGIVIIRSHLGGIKPHEVVRLVYIVTHRRQGKSQHRRYGYSCRKNNTQDPFFHFFLLESIYVMKKLYFNSIIPLPPSPVKKLFANYAFLIIPAPDKKNQPPNDRCS